MGGRIGVLTGLWGLRGFGGVGGGGRGPEMGRIGVVEGFPRVLLVNGGLDRGF